MTADQIAINSVSTSGRCLEERLDAYAAAGFKNVEFQLGQVKDELDTLGVEGVRSLLTDRGLRCIGGFEGGVEAFSDRGRREVNHARTCENARLLESLGGTSLVVGTDGPGQPCQDPLDILAATFRELADRIAETGVTLLIEFNWSPIVNSLRTAAEIARMSGAANVGVLFDPAHYHCTPSKFEQINGETVRVIRHVHADDMRDKPGELSLCNDDRVLPGEGCVGVERLFAALEEFGYRGFFSIEMFDPKLWAMPPLEASGLMYDSMARLCER